VGAPIGQWKDLAAYAPTYYSPPVPIDVQVDDNGDSTLTVRAMGAFKMGTYVRIGSLTLGPTQGVVAGSGPANPSNTGTPAANNANSTPTPAPSNTPSGNSPASNSPAGNTPSGTGGNTNTANANTGNTNTNPQNQNGAQPPAQQTQQPSTQQSVTPNSFYVTQNYIKFTAQASLIALNGAHLVGPDGYEYELIRGYSVPPPLTCQEQIEYYLSKTASQSTPTATMPSSPPSQPAGAPPPAQTAGTHPPAQTGGTPSASQTTPTPSSPKEIQNNLRQLEYNSQLLLASKSANGGGNSTQPDPCKDQPATATISPYSDTKTLVTLHCVPTPDPTVEPNPLPVALIGSSLYGLRD
jgi:hypothetical protein